MDAFGVGPESGMIVKKAISGNHNMGGANDSCETPCPSGPVWAPAGKRIARENRIVKIVNEEGGRTAKKRQHPGGSHFSLQNNQIRRADLPPPTPRLPAPRPGRKYQPMAGRLQKGTERRQTVAAADVVQAFYQGKDTHGHSIKRCSGFVGRLAIPRKAANVAERWSAS